MSLETQLIAGVDEVGRGPLAGPVVAAAVILNPEKPILGLTDSKKLTAKKREVLAIQIQKYAWDWGIGCAEAQEIDTYNILQATLLAMQRAVNALRVLPKLALIDGNQKPTLNCAMQTIIKGDEICPAISAASIVAKVTRDAKMHLLHSKYPEYGFAQHKGYGTPQHLIALRQYGYTPLHRRSFAPVNRCLQRGR